MDRHRSRRECGASRAKVGQSLMQTLGGASGEDKWARAMGYAKGVYTYLFDSPSILENTDNPRRMTGGGMSTEVEQPEVNY